MLLLEQVQLTKKEATELRALANERQGSSWTSDYHVSFSFVLCIINACNTQELPGGRKRTVLQRGCVAILTHTTKRHIFVKENLSNSSPVVTRIANVFCLSLDVLQGGNRLQLSYSVNNITTSVD